LTTFVGYRSTDMYRNMQDEVRSLRPVWMSVGRDQHVLKTISRLAKAIARVFAADQSILLGEPAPLEASKTTFPAMRT
ncbi:MAG: hypothetical protein ACREDP_06285, partial [Bradyrhizobium sp.]